MTEQDPTALAVAIGALQTDVKYIREGIEEIKNSAASANERVGAVETGLEIANTRLDGHDKILAEQKAAKAPWWSVVAGITGIVTGAGAIITLVALFAKLGTL